MALNTRFSIYCLAQIIATLYKLFIYNLQHALRCFSAIMHYNFTIFVLYIHLVVSLSHVTLSFIGHYRHPTCVSQPASCHLFLTLFVCFISLLYYFQHNYCVVSLMSDLTLTSFYTLLILLCQIFIIGSFFINHSLLVYSI